VVVKWKEEQLCLGHVNSRKLRYAMCRFVYSVRIMLYQTYLSGNQSPVFYFVLNHTEVVDSI